MDKPVRIPDHKDTIIVHCLATSRSWGESKTAAEMVEEVRRWHVEERGWDDVAYAGIIDYPGGWAPGRDLNNDGNTFDDTGAAAKGWNRRGIHIALAGGRGASANDRFSDHFTMEQDERLRSQIAVIEWLAGRKMQLKGHNEISNKGCPGFQVRPWFEEKPPRKIRQSKTVQGAGLITAGTATAAAQGFQVFSELDPQVQLALIGAGALTGFGLGMVFRARLTDWVNGRR